MCVRKSALLGMCVESWPGCSAEWVRYLISLRTVAPDEVLTHSRFARHVDVAVRAATVVADSFQEVRTHRHLKREGDRDRDSEWLSRLRDRDTSWLFNTLFSTVKIVWHVWRTERTTRGSLASQQNSTQVLFIRPYLFILKKIYKYEKLYRVCKHVEHMCLMQWLCMNACRNTCSYSYSGKYAHTIDMLTILFCRRRVYACYLHVWIIGVWKRVIELFPNSK